jgi:ketosteroid isomerase-like protein
MSTQALTIARSYFRAVEQGVTGDALAAFFTPDVVQEEFPNRLNPTGVRRDLAAILEGAVRGQSVLRSQRIQIVSSVGTDDRLALEVEWRGVFSVPLGTLAAGDEMRARFAVFLEFRDGRIARQRNYDCFDPW